MSSRKRQYTQRSPEQWQALIKQFESSNLGPTEFIELHDLPTSSFYQWRSKLKRKPPARKPYTSKKELIEVTPVKMNKIKPTDNPDWDIELSIGDNVVLRIKS